MSANLEPGVARVRYQPQPAAWLLSSAEYRLELRATDRLLAPVGPTKSLQKAPNMQERALSTSSVVFELPVFPTKSRPEAVATL